MPNIAKSSPLFRYTVLLIFVTFFSASAQKAQLTSRQAQERFLRHVYTQPDSARYYLHYMVRIDRNEPDSIRGKHYNNLGLLHGMNSNPDSARFYYEKSIKIGSLRNRLGTMINLAVIHKKAREFDKAISILEKVVEGYTELNDEKGLGTAYGELGSVYSVRQQRVRAIDYLTKGIALSKKHNMTRPLAIQQQNLATIYYKSRNYAYAKDLFEECLPQLKASNDKMSYAIALANYGSTLLFMGDTKRSLEVLTEAAVLLAPIENDNIKAIVYGNIAAIHQKNGHVDRALRQYETSYGYILKARSPESLSVISGYIALLNSQQKYDRALEIVNNIESTIDFKKSNEIEKLDFYEEASQTLLNTNHDDRGVKALKDVIALKDTVFEIENDQQLKEIEAKYQTQNQREQTEYLRQSNARLAQDADSLVYKYRYTLYGIFVLIVILGFAYFALRKKQKAVAVLNQKHRQKEQELDLQRDQLKDKETLIEKQHRQLLGESLKNVNHAEQLKAIINEFRSDNYPGSASKIQSMADSSHWSQFIEKFNAVNPYFIQKLSTEFPQLNQSELQFCALVRVNLSYKEIANILQITHQSVFTKKYRITKKMAIEGDTNFQNFIRSL